jgi:hypothetical protein
MARHRADGRLGLCDHFPNIEPGFALLLSGLLKVDQQSSFNIQKFEVVSELLLFRSTQFTADCFQFHDQVLVPKVNDEVGIAFAYTVVLVFQFDNFLALISNLRHTQPDLQCSVVDALRETGAKSLIYVLGDFPNFFSL